MPYARTRLGRLFFEEHPVASGEAEADERPIILLLHGLLFDRSMWAAQIGPLSALGRVVVVDGPGHGRSEPPPRFVLEEHADALLDVLDAVDARRAVLAGLSWGGMVAMRFALQHATRTAGLALLDTSAGGVGLVDRVRARSFAALNRRVGFPRALFDAGVANLMFAKRTRRERPDLVDDAFRRAVGLDPHAVGRAVRAVSVKRTSILERLDHITAPTLVLCGAEDAATPPWESEAIARAIPGAELVLIDGVGHMTTLEAPDEVNAHLVPFVERVLSLPR